MYDLMCNLAVVFSVSGISSYFNGGSWTLYRSIYVVRGTRWWNIMKWFLNSRDVIPSVTSNWWTIYVCDFSVTRWTPSSRHFCCLRSEMLLLQLLLMEHSSSSVHHLSHLQPCQQTLIISSFVLRRLLHQDYSSKTVLWSTTFRVNFEKLYNCEL